LVDSQKLSIREKSRKSMSLIKAYSSDHFVLPLPKDHRFPIAKYALLRQRVEVFGIAELHVPDPAEDGQILRCHSADYLDKIKSGRLSRKEVLRIGFPWSPEMVERSRRSAGATIAAAHAALSEGIGANLAGGTHHACIDHGEGYCIWNDAAIAARDLQARGLVSRVLIVDCDVHQGNGTAQITYNDPTIFTFSIHGEKNFPYRKFPSDLDIGLPDRLTDEPYLDLVEEGLRRAIFYANADLAIYIAGADPYERDRLGKLSISKIGLARRDRIVIEMLREAGLPVAIAMGGGYASDINDIVDIHFETIRIAAATQGLEIGSS
jgi:acetoin utilization deacetylase AcuC-like enzyme